MEFDKWAKDQGTSGNGLFYTKLSEEISSNIH